MAAAFPLCFFFAGALGGEAACAALGLAARPPPPSAAVWGGSDGCDGSSSGVGRRAAGPELPGPGEDAGLASPAAPAAPALLARALQWRLARLRRWFGEGVCVWHLVGEAGVLLGCGVCGAVGLEVVRTPLITPHLIGQGHWSIAGVITDFDWESCAGNRNGEWRAWRGETGRSE